MKKIISLLLVLLSIVMLTGCKSKEERAEEKLIENFQTYMSNYKPLTRSDINNALSQTSTSNEYNDVKIGNILITNDSNVQSTYDRVYVWQSNQRIYFAQYNSNNNSSAIF